MNTEKNDKLFLELFEESRILLTFIVRKTLGFTCPHDASDVMQETFIKCRRNFKPEAIRSFKQWVVQSGKNNAIDRLRAHNRHSKHYVDSGQEDCPGTSLLENIPGKETPETIVSGAEQNELRFNILREAMGQVSHEQLQVIVLRHFMELTFEEVSARLGINQNTVKSRLRRALEKMREYFLSKGITSARFLEPKVV